MNKNIDPLPDPITQKVARWYEDHGKSVKGYIGGIIGFNDNDVEDLTQEVFKQAMRHLRKPESKEITHPKAWLLKIAENECKKYLNKNNQFVISINTDDQGMQLLDSLADKEAYQPENLILAENTELAEAIKKLTPEERHILDRHLLQELTYKEISVVSGIKPEKEGRDVRSAIEKLRKLLLYPQE